MTRTLVAGRRKSFTNQYDALDYAKLYQVNHRYAVEISYDDVAKRYIVIVTHQQSN